VWRAAYALGGSLTGLDTYTTIPPQGLWVGLGYGLLVWFVGVVVCVPLWSQVVLDGGSSVPLLHWLSGLALIAYGALLGTVYARVATAGY